MCEREKNWIALHAHHSLVSSCVRTFPGNCHRSTLGSHTIAITPTNYTTGNTTYQKEESCTLGCFQGGIYLFSTELDNPTRVKDLVSTHSETCDSACTHQSTSTPLKAPRGNHVRYGGDRDGVNTSRNPSVVIECFLEPQTSVANLSLLAKHWQMNHFTFATNNANIQCPASYLPRLSPRSRYHQVSASYTSPRKISTNEHHLQPRSDLPYESIRHLCQKL